MKKVASVIALIAGLTLLGVNNVLAAFTVGLTADVVGLAADYSTDVNDNLSVKQIVDVINVGGGTATIDTFGELLYKYETDNKEITEGTSLHDSYTTTLFDSRTGFTVRYDGGQYANATYLVIKDGDFGSLIWDISQWDGIKDLVASATPGFWVKENGEPKTISNFAFYGFRMNPDPSPVVPEPSTYLAGSLLLLPFASSVLRKLRKKVIPSSQI